jgi:hypothetical protein
VRFALLAIVAIAGAALQVASGSSSPAAPVRRVPCGEAIATTKFPYVTAAGDYRLVLGVVSAPPAYLPRIYRADSPERKRGWPFWRKQGIIVRNSGESVAISVPSAWRTRAGIVWGNGGTGEPFTSVLLVGCGSDRTRGRAYAGGFYLRSRAACVPLMFRVGRRAATVRFGINRRCGPSS